MRLVVETEEADSKDFFGIASLSLGRSSVSSSCAAIWPTILLLLMWSRVGVGCWVLTAYIVVLMIVWHSINIFCALLRLTASILIECYSRLDLNVAALCPRMWLVAFGVAA